MAYWFWYNFWRAGWSSSKRFRTGREQGARKGTVSVWYVSSSGNNEVAPTGWIGRTWKGATIAVGMIFILLFGGSPFTGEPDSELEADSTTEVPPGTWLLASAWTSSLCDFVNKQRSLSSDWGWDIYFAQHLYTHGWGRGSATCSNWAFLSLLISLWSLCLLILFIILW